MKVKRTRKVPMSLDDICDGECVQFLAVKGIASLTDLAERLNEMRSELIVALGEKGYKTLEKKVSEFKALTAERPATLEEGWNGNELRFITGIPEIDSLLTKVNHTFFSISGPPGAGKSTLAIQLSVLTALTLNRKVVYIDTERSIDSSFRSRLAEIAEVYARIVGKPQKEAFERIFFAQASTFEELSVHIERNSENVVVIDSFSSALKDDPTDLQRRRQRLYLLKKWKALYDANGGALVFVNHVYKTFDMSGGFQKSWEEVHGGLLLGYFMKLSVMLRKPMRRGRKVVLEIERASMLTPPPPEKGVVQPEGLVLEKYGSIEKQIAKSLEFLPVLVSEK